MLTARSTGAESPRSARLRRFRARREVQQQALSALHAWRGELERQLAALPKRGGKRPALRLGVTGASNNRGGAEDAFPAVAKVLPRCCPEAGSSTWPPTG